MDKTCLDKSNVPTDAVNLLQIKILYWGPGEAGKTTNFHRLKEYFKEYLISEGYSVETSNHRTLWNDSIHLRFYVKSISLVVIVILTTTTGQKRFLSTREYILQNTDGVIFVADSTRKKISENIRSFQELTTLIGNRDIPLLILLNKRDIMDRISVAELASALDIPSLSKNSLKECENQIIYTSIANRPKNSGDVQLIFMDLLQKILEKQLMNKL